MHGLPYLLCTTLDLIMKWLVGTYEVRHFLNWSVSQAMPKLSQIRKKKKNTDSLIQSIGKYIHMPPVFSHRTGF